MKIEINLSQPFDQNLSGSAKSGRFLLVDPKHAIDWPCKDFEISLHIYGYCTIMLIIGSYRFSILIICNLAKQKEEKRKNIIAYKAKSL